MTTSESKGRFFLLNESIRITNRIESIRIANWNALLERPSALPNLCDSHCHRRWNEDTAFQQNRYVSWKKCKGITFSKRDVYRSLDRSVDTLTTSVLSPGDLLSVYARRVSSFLTAHQHIISHFSAMTGQIDIRTDTRTRFQLNLPFLQILPTTALPFSSSMTI